MLVVIMSQMVVLFLTVHANGTSPPCRRIAPAWICDRLGYLDSTLALPGAARLDAAGTSTRRDDLFDIPRQPGVPPSVCRSCPLARLR